MSLCYDLPACSQQSGRIDKTEKKEAVLIDSNLRIFFVSNFRSHVKNKPHT